MARLVSGFIKPGDVVLHSGKNLPAPDFRLRGRLEEMIKSPNTLVEWYSALGKKERTVVCRQLDLWCRDVGHYGPQNSWQIVNVVFNDPSTTIRNATVRRVANSVIDSPYTLDEDKRDALRALRLLDTLVLDNGMKMPSRPPLKRGQTHRGAQALTPHHSTEEAYQRAVTSPHK